MGWEPCELGEWTPLSKPIGYGRGRYGVGLFGGIPITIVQAPTLGIWQEPVGGEDGEWESDPMPVVGAWDEPDECESGEWTSPSQPVGYGRHLYGAGPFGGIPVSIVKAPETGTWAAPDVCKTGTWRMAA